MTLAIRYRTLIYCRTEANRTPTSLDVSYRNDLYRNGFKSGASVGRTTLIHVRVAAWVLVIWLAAQMPSSSNASWVPARTSRETTLEPGEHTRSPFRATSDRQKMAFASYTYQPFRFEATEGLGFTFSSGMGYSLVLAPGEAILKSNGLQRSDLGLLGRKSDGSSAVPEHPQSQVRTNSSSMLRMKLVGASVSARILGLDPLPVKSNYFISRIGL